MSIEQTRIPTPEPSRNTVLGERRQLINLAYRLLGTLAEAEDVVQETYARWYAMPPPQRAAIRSPGGWLTTVASRICLDMLGSARARRERYVGEWIPEPLPARARWSSVSASDHAGDPADLITLDESVTMAFLVTLESMAPAERVTLVLHDVFGYSFSEIAKVVGRTPGSCRHLASSARGRARAYRSASSPATTEQPAPQATSPGSASGQPNATGQLWATGRADTVRAFREAWRARDIDALLGLLDPDSTAITDGGGLAFAARDPIEGAERVTRHYVAIADRMPTGTAIVECLVNGQPGLAVRNEDVTVTVLAFDLSDGRITRIWAVLNPAKLRRWNTNAPAPG